MKIKYLIQVIVKIELRVVNLSSTRKQQKNFLDLTCPEKYFLSKMNEDLLKVSNSLICLYLDCSKKV